MATLEGGDKLTRALEDIARQLDEPGTLRVGFLEGATYPEAEGGMPVAAIAAFNEFGVPSHNQPPRPFFRDMITRQSDHWGSDLAKILKAARYRVAPSLNLMGEEIAGELRESIQALVSPPLADATVARKGFDKPLVETGHMLASIDQEVT